jgi:hypothetical protein
VFTVIDRREVVQALGMAAVVPAGVQPGHSGLAARMRATISQIGLDRLDGDNPVYFPSGYADRAARVQRLVTAQRDYYRTRLGVDLPIIVAVLDRPRWRPPFSDGSPWGLALVRHDTLPAVTVIPTTSAGTPFAAPAIDRLPPAWRRRFRDQVNFNHAFDEAGEYFVMHELGHPQADRAGVYDRTFWFDEFMASYFGHVVWRDRFPERRDFFFAMSPFIFRPPYPIRDLGAFESRMDPDRAPENYGWFQDQFARRADAVYDAQGFEFIERVRSALPPKGGRRLSNPELLDQLEAITPGWRAWAAALPIIS